MVIRTNVSEVWAADDLKKHSCGQAAAGIRTASRPHTRSVAWPTSATYAASPVRWQQPLCFRELCLTPLCRAGRPVRRLRPGHRLHHRCVACRWPLACRRLTKPLSYLLRRLCVSGPRHSPLARRCPRRLRPGGPGAKAAVDLTLHWRRVVRAVPDGRRLGGARGAGRHADVRSGRRETSWMSDERRLCLALI